jgi:hypothetical protein
MRPTLKFILWWMVAALVIFLFWNVSARIQKNEPHLSFSDFLVQLERGHVNDVTITGNFISGTFKNGQSFRTYAPPQADGLVERLLDKGIVVNARDVNSSSWLEHLISWTPIVIMIAFLIFFMRQMQGSTDSETSARIWTILSGSEADLSAAELASRLPTVSEEKLQRALYGMLREGTIVLTAARKYRARTAD